VNGRFLHRFAVAVACATFLLIIAGGLVTSTGSGLAVPDWPLSYGQVFPRMEGGVLFEHGHRLLAAAVGFLTVLLAIFATMSGARRGIRILGWCLVGAVVLQGILGGVTVLLRLPDSVSVAHAGLAQIFFALTVVMAVVTSPAFADIRPSAGPIDGTRSLATWTAIVVYAQILLGAIVRHTGAGLAIPGFPTANGRLIPEFTSALVAWQFAHRVGAVFVTVMVMWSAIRIFRRHGDAPSLVRPAALLLALTSWQIFLGALTIWTWRAVTPTTAHVATGALVFVTSVVLAVRTHRIAVAKAPDEMRALIAEPAG
jgi:cytochrome c oxidase assembly protein subunit 15